MKETAYSTLENLKRINRKGWCNDGMARERLQKMAGPFGRVKASQVWCGGICMISSLHFQWRGIFQMGLKANSENEYEDL